MTIGERRLLRELEIRIIYNPDYQIMLEGLREIIDRGKILKYTEYSITSIEDFLITNPIKFPCENEIIILLGVLDSSELLKESTRNALIKFVNNSKITFAISNQSVNIEDMNTIENEVDDSEYIYINGCKYNSNSDKHFGFKAYKKFQLLTTADEDYIESSIDKNIMSYMINIISGEVEISKTNLTSINKYQIIDESDFYHIFNNKITNGLSVFFNKSNLMSEVVAREFAEKFFDHIHICAGIWKLSDASQFEKIFENDVVVIAGFDRLDFFELESYLNNVSLINKSRAVLLIPDRLLEVSKPHSENIAVEFETAMHAYSGKLGISYSYYGDDTKHELPKVMTSSEYLTDIYSHIIWRESDLDPHDNNLELSAIEMLLLDIEGQEGLNFQIWRTRESAEKEEEIKNEE